MKLFSFLFLIMFNLSTYANNECTYSCDAKAVGHESFCESLNRFSCEAHSNLCTVYQNCPSSPSPNTGNCYSYEYIYEAYCESLSNKHACVANDKHCYWR